MSDRPVASQPAPLWVLAALLTVGFGGQALVAPEQIGEEVSSQLRDGNVLDRVVERVSERVTDHVEAKLQPLVARVEALDQKVIELERDVAATRRADEERARHYAERSAKWEAAYEREMNLLSGLTNAIPELTAAAKELRGARSGP